MMLNDSIGAELIPINQIEQIKLKFLPVQPISLFRNTRRKLIVDFSNSDIKHGYEFDKSPSQ